MTDASGTVVWSADYKPFGEAINITGSITNNLRGAGQYFDAETGLLYNYSRNLNTTIGRYNEADRIGLRGGINPYVFVGNNPLLYIDPYGLRQITILDFEPLAWPFHTKHFKDEFLEKVREEKDKDYSYKAEWEQLDKNYSFGKAFWDQWFYDPDEAIKHYREKFEKERNELIDKWRKKNGGC